MCWNSNPTDVVNGSVKPSFDLLRPWIRNCHINELTSGYPYRELFGLLRQSEYERYTLCECAESQGAGALPALLSGIVDRTESGMIRRAVLAAGALLSALVAAAAVPTPASHFGHRIGADRTVLDWDKVVTYFDALAKSSDRIRVRGTGQEHRRPAVHRRHHCPPDTLRHLDRYIDIQRRLADPRITDAAEAEQLIHDGKTVVLITCSIHSTEVASTQTAVEFAYRLLTEDKPRFRAILENTIFILVPSLNPDGVDIVSAVVSQDARHAVRGHVAAAALPQVRGPR